MSQTLINLYFHLISFFLQLVELRNTHRDVTPQLQALIGHFAQGSTCSRCEILQMLISKICFLMLPTDEKFF